jgi:hypothetical protein
MQPKSTTTFTLFKKIITIPVIALIAQLGLNSCSKEAIVAAKQEQAGDYFASNILNSNFRVQMATDNGADITSQYTGFTFVLQQYTLSAGSMTATKNGVTYIGNWACNSDYSKLTISLPNLPSEFVFLNRDWKFTKKALPVMELAPWGTTEPKVLHMEKF